MVSASGLLISLRPRKAGPFFFRRSWQQVTGIRYVCSDFQRVVTGRNPNLGGLRLARWGQP